MKIANFIILTLLSVLPVKGMDIVLAWDLNTETDIAGYKIFQSTNPPIFTVIADMKHPSNRLPVSGLSAGVTYTFYATAYNTAGMESEPSVNVVFTVPTANKPFITQQPKPLNVRVGLPALFSVAATGDQPLSYQWYKDGYALAGSTSASYSISATVAENAGMYQCRVSNAYGFVFSQSAQLSIVLPPGIIKNFRKE